MADELSQEKFFIFIQESTKYFRWEDIMADAGITNASDKGSQYEITCPFHEDKRPSCRLNKETGQFHCFSCGRKGTYTKFLWELNGKQQPYSRYCEQVLKARPDIQKACGFTSIFVSEKTLDPAFEKRRVFNPASTMGTPMSYTTLYQKVKGMGDEWENLVTSLTLLQQEVKPESVIATMTKKQVKVSVPTERIGLMDLLGSD